MFRQTGSSLALLDKEFVGKETAIKDWELELRVWKYFIFLPAVLQNFMYTEFGIKHEALVHFYSSCHF